MDVSGGILHTWMPAIHAGMTKISISCSVGERKIMNHFVVSKTLNLEPGTRNRWPAAGYGCTSCVNQSSGTSRPRPCAFAAS
jgi:hypothetical protein